MKSPMQATAPVVLFAALCIPLQSHAYLGGFEAGDGYMGFVNWLNGYNAGQYGSANGGPGGSANNP